MTKVKATQIVSACIYRVCNVFNDVKFSNWADKWLLGTDRTEETINSLLVPINEAWVKSNPAIDSNWSYYAAQLTLMLAKFYQEVPTTKPAYIVDSVEDYSELNLWPILIDKVCKKVESND